MIRRNGFDEAKIIKVLDDWLPKVPIEQRNNASIIDEDKELIEMCPANISMIIAKSKRMKSILWQYIEKTEERKERKRPELDYEIKAEDKLPLVSKSKYSLEYLKKIMKLMECTGESGLRVEIKLRPDYPGSFSNEDVEVILAPRVEE